MRSDQTGVSVTSDEQLKELNDRLMALIPMWATERTVIESVETYIKYLKDDRQYIDHIERLEKERAKALGKAAGLVRRNAELENEIKKLKKDVATLMERLEYNWAEKDRQFHEWLQNEWEG